MATYNLDFQARLNDKGFKSGLQQMTRQVNTLGDTLKKVGAIAISVFGGAGILATMKQSIGLWAEQEKSTLKLTFAVKQFAGENKTLLKSLQDLGGQLQKSIGVGNEYVENLASIGLSVGITSDKITDATKASILLSKAVGVDANTILRGFSQTLEGQVGILGRYIPQLKNLTEEELKSGKAIDFVVQNFGDLEQTLSTTTEASIEKFKASFGDILEVLGSKFSPIIAVVADAMFDFANAVGKSGSVLKTTWNYLKNWYDGLNILGKSVVSFAGLYIAFEIFSKAWSLATQIILNGGKTMVAIFRTVSNPAFLFFVGIIAGVELLRTAWYNNWGGIRDKTLEIWNKIQPVFEGMKNWFDENKDKLINWSWHLLGNAWEWLKSTWKEIQPYVKEAFVWLWDKGKQVVDWSLNILGDGWSWLKDTWQNIKEPLKEVFVNLFEKGEQFVKWSFDILGDAWNWLQNNWDNIKEYIKNAFNWLWDKGEQALKWTFNFAGDAWNWILETWQKIEPYVVNAFKYLWDKGNQFVEWGFKIAGDAWDYLKNNSLKDIIDDLKKKIDEGLGSLNFDFDEVAKQTLKTLQELGEGLIVAIKWDIRSFIDTYNYIILPIFNGIREVSATLVMNTDENQKQNAINSIMTGITAGLGAKYIAKRGWILSIGVALTVAGVDFGASLVRDIIDQVKKVKFAKDEGIMLPLQLETMKKQMSDGAKRIYEILETNADSWRGMIAKKLLESANKDRSIYTDFYDLGLYIGFAILDGISFAFDKMNAIQGEYENFWKGLQNKTDEWAQKIFNKVFTFTIFGIPAFQDVSAIKPKKARGDVPAFATGNLAYLDRNGVIQGSGTDTSDNILAWLSPGEAVINARATREYLPLLKAINSMKLPRYADGKVELATGVANGEKTTFVEQYFTQINKDLKALGGVVTTLTDKLFGNTLSALDSNVEKMNDLNTEFENLNNPLKDLKSQIDNTGNTFEELNDPLKNFAEQISMMTDNQVLVKASEGIAGAFVKKTDMGIAGGQDQKLEVPILESFSDVLQTQTIPIIKGFSQAFEKLPILGGELSGILTALAGSFTEILAPMALLTPVIEGLFGVLSPVINSIFKPLFGFLKSLGQMIGVLLLPAFMALKIVLLPLVAIITAVQTAFDKIVLWVDSLPFIGGFLSDEQRKNMSLSFEARMKNYLNPEPQTDTTTAESTIGQEFSASRTQNITYNTEIKLESVYAFDTDDKPVRDLANKIKQIFREEGVLPNA